MCIYPHMYVYIHTHIYIHIHTYQHSFEGFLAIVLEIILDFRYSKRNVKPCC